MVEVIIKKTEALSGEVAAPPSKAYTQRMFIAASMSSGVSNVENYLVSDDTTTTLNAIKAFGAITQAKNNILEVKGVEQPYAPKKPVNCGESGATLRFLVPVAALANGNTTFTMGPSLSRRPLAPLLDSLKQLGVETYYRAGEPFVKVYGGGIQGGRTILRGDISSQYVSGLMFACPMARRDTEIVLTTPLESKSYVEMTGEVLTRHEVNFQISEDFRLLKIPHGQKYKPCNHVVPGDFSSAAYILAAAGITSSRIRVKNLNCDTRQGDKVILEILKQAGLEVNVDGEFVEVGGVLQNAISMDARDAPDLVPICAVLACYTKGISRIYNAGRLRYKESDRLVSTYTELKKMGAEIIIGKDSLIIKGPCEMRGAIIDPYNDHRIAMACAVAALSARGETKILNAECVRKSYPSFFKDLKSLGASVIG
ncbi:MAG: 3-phosphoshikimate 1-carboxyvinyltransferase [Candidatus Bathyarchaeia archaeon]